MADTLQAVREAYAEARLDYPNLLAWEELSLEMHEALIQYIALVAVTSVPVLSMLMVGIAPNFLP